MKLTVPVMGGSVGVGDRVIWYSKTFGMRNGKIRKIVQEEGNNTYISVTPDSDPYTSVPLKNFPYVLKETGFIKSMFDLKGEQDDSWE